MKELSCLTSKTELEEKTYWFNEAKNKLPDAIIEGILLSPILIAPSYGLGSAINYTLQTGGQDLKGSLARLGFGFGIGTIYSLGAIMCAAMSARGPIGEQEISSSIDEFCEIWENYQEVKDRSD